MALITCPDCGKQISNLAKTCPNCGYPIGSAKDEEYVKQFNSQFGEYEDGDGVTEYIWRTEEGTVEVAYPLGVILTLEYSAQ